MIKVGDSVILKEPDEIAFKSIEEMHRYQKWIDLKHVSVGIDYLITMKLSFRNNKQILYYNVTFVNGVGQQILYPMTWFRNKQRLRNRKIDTILK